MLRLKEKLDSLYLKYQKRFSSADPVWVLHRLSGPGDIEIMGLIAASYSYGQVGQINLFTEKLLSRISNKPYEFTINFTKRKDKKFLEGLNYRFNTYEDLAKLFGTLSEAVREHGSLKNLFLKGFKPESANTADALMQFISDLHSRSHDINGTAGSNFNYLLPNPVNKSTCKRMNLYLRWMVRKDQIDTGIWGEIDKSKLIIPVDVHVARVSKKLGLVKRKSVDLKFALELTETLKKFDKEDPVKYDFSLCHIGIEGIEI